MKIRRTYTREFKLQIVRECENSKAMAQLSRQHGIHPSLITRWKKEYRDDPENAFSGKGNIYKEDARLGELERVIGQLYAENSFLKKALSNLEMRLQEQRRKDTQR
ncbi:MAG: transposase [Methanosarcinales archaeon]|jgi:transposase|nr:MAG: transposase [ANME-2 cluster archaeon]MCD4846158.1 transposase [Methanosarcinales archaeon]